MSDNKAFIADLCAKAVVIRKARGIRCLVGMVFSTPGALGSGVQVAVYGSDFYPVLAWYGCRAIKA